MLFAKAPAGISALRLGKGVRVLRVFRLIRVLKGGGILQDWAILVLGGSRCGVLSLESTRNGHRNASKCSKVLAKWPKLERPRSCSTRSTRSTA